MIPPEGAGTHAPEDVVRIVIVDDQALLRTGFRLILESDAGLNVVGEAADGLEALQVIATTRPDIVLMDVRMPNLDGIEATRQALIAAGDNAPKVLMLTTFDMDDYVYAALRAGASGFLLKDIAAEELKRAVYVVAAGEALLAPSVTRRLISEFSRRSSHERPAPGVMEKLTEREREVVTQIARGMSNAEIANELFVSETTIKTHVSAILMKLDLRDRVQVVVMAYESGLMSNGS